PDGMRARLARWLPCLLLALLPAFVHAQLSATTNTVAGEFPVLTSTNTLLASAAPAGTYHRAPWQQRFTLGPGDVLKVSLFGSPEVTRNEVTVAPDGRVGFLEAQDIIATGLTIDELRVKLDKALEEFRRAPRTMVSPVTLKSKKYCVLGRVVQRGVFPIDHPMTLLEAIAQAKGFELGIR